MTVTGVSGPASWQPRHDAADSAPIAAPGGIRSPAAEHITGCVTVIALSAYTSRSSLR
jgi:hypothetical protein